MSNAAPATSTEIHDAAPPRPSRSVIVGVRLLPDELRALDRLLAHLEAQRDANAPLDLERDVPELAALAVLESFERFAAVAAIEHRADLEAATAEVG